MNVLMFLQSGMVSHAVKRIFSEMDVKFCAYLFDGNKLDKIEAQNVELMPLYLYAPLEFFRVGESSMIPLDATVLEGVKPYAMTALDIINRWKKSISPKGSYGSLRDIYFVYLRYWNDFLLKNKIDFIYFQGMPHVPITYFIYALSKVYGIPIVLHNFMPLVGTNRLNNYLNVSLDKISFDFSDKLRENKELYSSGEINLRPELEMYFANYAKEAKKVENVIWFNEKNSLMESLKKYVDRGKIYISQKRYRILFQKIVYLLSIRQANKKIQKYAASKEMEPDFSVPFFFYPLHMQPESSTLPCGGVFADQLEVVRMVAASLPNGYFLYVKEHPAYWVRNHFESMREARDFKYYDAIASIKNVRLIRHGYNSLEIMEKCAAVVTVTGTAGFEALFKGKPALIFGDHFYSEFPGVFRIRSNDDCERAVKQIVNGEAFFSDRDLRVALKTLEPYVIPLAENSKAYMDAGVEPVREEDLVYCMDAVVRFARENYNIATR
jgi:hypothetical protein